MVRHKGGLIRGAGLCCSHRQPSSHAPARGVASPRAVQARHARHREHADHVATPKTAITMADLLAFHGLLDHSTFEGARNWCACTLAFFGLLRVNEYCNGHLRHEHVQQTGAGVVIVIAYSKTSLPPARVDISSRSDVLWRVAHESKKVERAGMTHCVRRCAQHYTPCFITLLPAASANIGISQLWVHHVTSTILSAQPLCAYHCTAGVRSTPPHQFGINHVSTQHIACVNRPLKATSEACLAIAHACAPRRSPTPYHVQLVERVMQLCREGIAHRRHPPTLFLLDRSQHSCSMAMYGHRIRHHGLHTMI